MGALLGLLLGTGLFLVWSALMGTDRLVARGTRSFGLTELLRRAGVEGVTPVGAALLSASVAVVTGAAMLAISGTPPVAVVFALMAAYLPIAVLRGRARRRQREFAELWPEAVDNLASAVRAGLSLSEGLVQLGERGPEPLREPFVKFARDYQASGRFNDCLDLLKRRLADPVGDRVVEGLRIARDVGGGDLGRMLRALSGFLRDDARTRAELESRQAWTINGARLAVAAPWLVLLMMSFQRDIISRYASTTGVLVLATGAASCLVAYRLMTWLGRLPVEQRILS
ncbi:MAG: type II secretion system F family protein [Nocardioidaceae bacterium]|nr:type II secretion system F family protein [Nocardioidaceae bacterium]